MEAYWPYILLCNEIASSVMSNAPDQAQAEKAFEDELRKAEELRSVVSVDAFEWPSHIPEPTSPPPCRTRERAIVDLVKFAAAYAFLHETRHVMFTNDGNPPADARDEEIECDKFARDFLLQKIPEYCASTGYPEEGVLNKRLMGVALGAFNLVAVTPKETRSGSMSHPPLGSRLRELLLKSSAPAGAKVWVFVCCLLLSVLRREGKLPQKLTYSDPRDLFEKLVILMES
jgi:hypothetical protein